MKYPKIFLIFLILFFCAGCASTPVSSVGSLQAPTYTINNISYVPLSSIANAYGTTLQWDSVARMTTIKKGWKELVFCAGSEIALINKKPKDMQHPAKMGKGGLLIPEGFASSVVKEEFFPEIVTAKKEVIPPYEAVYGIRTVVIDPGHGGKDPGAISASGIKEKNIVLKVARRIKSYLQDKGLRVILTRNRDTFVTLKGRADIANKSSADFFISIHANAARSRYARGIEVFYLSEAVDEAARAVEAAENASLRYEDSSYDPEKPKLFVDPTLWNMLYLENRGESIELAGCITEGMCKTLGVKNRGVKAARFYVLRYTKIPAVLVEIGFLSNRREAARLNSPEYQKRIARAITQGILLYKDKYEKTDGFTKDGE